MEQIFSPWNVVVLFDEVFTEELIKLSRFGSAKIPSKIILNKTDALPHMTLYTTNYPTSNLTKIKIELPSLLKKFHQFPVRFSSKVIDMNTVFINADPNMELHQLHIKIVDSLNPLRNGFYDNNELKLIGYNVVRKKSLLTYGMWAAKDLYVPHISVIRPFNVAQCKEALDLLPKQIHYMTMVRRIGLVERGHDGTCKKVLQTYSLKK